MVDCDDNKEFLCNTSLAKALLPFIPHPDRKNIQKWLKKLQDMGEDPSEAKVKNEYSFYLLQCMQNGNFSQPFNELPPDGQLKPLSRILSEFFYEEVQKQLKISYCRLKKMLNSNNEVFEMPDLRCDPSNFKTEHPRPRRGVTAAFAVFSNYDDDNQNRKA